MNRESDFQAHLDAHPDDHTARLVFADWLQERGDVRAEGYRALGLLRRVPFFDSDERRFKFASFPNVEPIDLHHAHVIPSDWMRAYGFSAKWASASRRSALENGMASAFARLHEVFKVAILAGAA